MLYGQVKVTVSIIWMYLKLLVVYKDPVQLFKYGIKEDVNIFTKKYVTISLSLTSHW
jgi:hypothetical protein